MNNQKYHILLVEPSQIVRTGLIQILEECEEYEVVTSLADLTEYEKKDGEEYDIVIINTLVINYTQRSNIRSLMNLSDSTYLFAFSYYPLDDSVKNQCDGFIYVHHTSDQIYKRLKNGIDVYKQTQRVEGSGLSSREKDILTAVALGKTNKEIAYEFNISIYTVVTHRKNISHKLGINTISGLTVYAILNGLVDVEDF